MPGVGAFPAAMQMLKSHNLVEILQGQAQKKPFLGICLGMQMLFEQSEEFGITAGLSLIPGRVVPMRPQGLKIPHMGWNELVVSHPSPLLAGVSTGAYVYFVHSFCADCEDDYIAAYCEYGQKVPALVQKGYVFGAQFHPEKSGEVGLTGLKTLEFAMLFTGH